MNDRKSWRERDRQKDKSAHRKEERAGSGRAPRVESATAAYKRKLDAFFDKGVVPDHLKDKLPGGSKGAPSERQTILRSIRDSKGGSQLAKAFDKLLLKYDMPDEPEIWLRGLEHPKDSVLMIILNKIEEYLGTGMPLPRKGRFVERLKGLEFSSFDPRVQVKSVQLAGRLLGLPDD